MDIRTRYDIGCQLYKVNKNDDGYAKVEILTIINIQLEPIGGAKCNINYVFEDSAAAFRCVKEKEINKEGYGYVNVFDNREQAYQAACRLIDEDIERQLDVIREDEKV